MSSYGYGRSGEDFVYFTDIYAFNEAYYIESLAITSLIESENDDIEVY